MKRINILKGLLLGVIVCMYICAISGTANANVCFVGKNGACDTRVSEDNDAEGTPMCTPGNNRYVTNADCQNSLGNVGYEMCALENNCYIRKCKYATPNDCTKAMGKTCVANAYNGCPGLKDLCEMDYPYRDNNLSKCAFIQSMGSVKSDKTALYGITKLAAGVSYNSTILTCDLKLAGCGCDIASKTALGTTEKTVCYQGKGYTNAYDMWIRNGHQDQCTSDCLTCNNVKGYYNTKDECEAKNGSGTCIRVEEAGKSCYTYEKSCQSYGLDNYAKLNCTDPNTVKLPVNTNSAGLECGKCICDSGFSDPSDCVWPVCNASLATAGLSSADCDSQGYTLSKNDILNYDINDYHCAACPFNGDRWRCTPNFKVFDCSSYTNNAEDDDRFTLAGMTCEQCPTDPAKFKCPQTPEIGAFCVASGFTTALEGSYELELKEREGYTCTGCPMNDMIDFNMGYYRCERPVVSCPAGFSVRASSCDASTPITEKWEMIPGYSQPQRFVSGSEIAPCAHDIWLRQFAYSDNKYCNLPTTKWKQYRCKKGHSGENPCLSDLIYEYREGAPEPCALLLGAEPDPNCH